MNLLNSSETTSSESDEALNRVRNYWDIRPCNIRHSPKPVGTDEYFRGVEERKYLVEPHIPGFAQFERWKDKKVLEIGCGIGTDSVNFARAGANLTAIDLSSRSIAVAQRRFELYDLEGRFYCGNAEQLTSVVPIERFDLIYSFGVIHHTPRPERVFEQILNYCGPETEIRIMVYSKWCWKILWIILKYGHGAVWRARDLVQRYSEAQTGCPVTYFYSFKELRRLLHNFLILDIRKDHIFPYVIDKYVNYEYKFEWYFDWMPKRLFRWLERRLGWHTLVVLKPRPAMFDRRDS